MTPETLGDNLAHLVWESFSDFFDPDDPGVSLLDMGIQSDDGASPGHTAEEALIFLLWTHTRAVQLAFVSRAQATLIRAGLDAMHRAVFADMVEHGTPESQLPLFEQRVGARYAEYNQAAATSDHDVSRAAVRHLTGRRGEPAHAAAILDRALSVAHPLRDFLAEVELTAG